MRRLLVVAALLASASLSRATPPEWVGKAGHFGEWQIFDKGNGQFLFGRSNEVLELYQGKSDKPVILYRLLIRSDSTNFWDWIKLTLKKSGGPAMVAEYQLKYEKEGAFVLPYAIKPGAEPARLRSLGTGSWFHALNITDIKKPEPAQAKPRPSPATPQRPEGTPVKQPPARGSKGKAAPPEDKASSKPTPAPESPSRTDSNRELDEALSALYPNEADKAKRYLIRQFLLSKDKAYRDKFIGDVRKAQKDNQLSAFRDSFLKELCAQEPGSSRPAAELPARKAFEEARRLERQSQQAGKTIETAKDYGHFDGHQKDVAAPVVVAAPATPKSALCAQLSVITPVPPPSAPPGQGVNDLTVKDLQPQGLGSKARGNAGDSSASDKKGFFSGMLDKIKGAFDSDTAVGSIAGAAAGWGVGGLVALSFGLATGPFIGVALGAALIGAAIGFFFFKK